MRFPEPGELFEQRYEIRRQLGAGGFSRVFEAHDRRANRPAALKILLPTGGQYTSETRARFDREVHAIASLSHPNTVTLYDRGEAESGVLYMVFEFVAGEDLADVLEREGRLEAATVRAILLQVLGSLAEAHAAGLVHRDIKPQNIRICSPPGAPIEIRVLDFGLARSTQSDSSITKTGHLIGTPRYMSPEQLMEQPLTPRSDIYSVGMVAFELLLGADALAGYSLADQLDRLRTGALFSVETLRQIGPDLLATIQRMTARHPEDRFPSAAAVLSALEQTGPGRGPPPPALASSVTAATPPPSNAMIAIGLIAVVGLIALIVALMPKAEQTPPTVAKPGVPVRANPLVRPTEPVDESQDIAVEADVATDLSDVPDHGLVINGSKGCRNARPEPPRGAAVLLPDGYSPAKPHPAVVWLMADQDSPMRIPTTTAFQRLIHDEGVLMIVPTEPSRGDWRSDQFDDVDRIVLDVQDNYCVDTTQTFVMSTGGSGALATVLACAPWAAGVAISSFAGPPHRLQRCAPIIYLTAKDSVHLPMQGGRNCIPVVGLAVEPYRNVEDRLRSEYGCRGRTKKVRDTRGMCKTWTCDVPFETCLFDGGIGWPGTPQSTVSKLGTNVGCNEPPPSTFDATPHVWRFFQRVSAKPK